MSPALSSAAGWSSSAMRASAARGSPWLPVASARILSRGRRSNASMPRNGGTPSSMPSSRATATTRSIARPRMHTCRPAAKPASAAERRRATLEAKVVTTTLPFALPTRSLSVAATSRSDGLSPSRSTLVESHTSASTPSSPSACEPRLVGDRADDRGRVDLPVAGVDDEAGRRPDRQRRAFRDRMGDRHELDVERADRHARAGPDDLDRNLRRARLAEPARLGEAGGEGRGVDLSAEARPQIGERADVVLVRVGDDDADEVLPHLLDEADVRHDRVDARQVLAGEGDAEIDHQPFARLRRPVTVERAIHADFAQAPEGREHELAVVVHSGWAFPHELGRTRRDGRAIRFRRYPEVGGLDRLGSAFARETAIGRPRQALRRRPPGGRGRRRSARASRSPAARASQAARIAAKSFASRPERRAPRRTAPTRRRNSSDAATRRRRRDRTAVG